MTVDTSRSELSNSKVLPSSKIGTALDMYSTDWSGKYPIEPEPATPLVTMTPGGWTPSPSPSISPTSGITREALMYSSKSGMIVPPESLVRSPSPSPSPLRQVEP